MSDLTRAVLSKYAIDPLANGTHPKDAARAAIEHLARRVGGRGGIILADRATRIGLSFNNVPEDLCLHRNGQTKSGIGALTGCSCHNVKK